MTIWAVVAILAIAALFCLWAAAYAAGKKAANLGQKSAEEKGREYVQKVVDSNANLSGDDLREWVRKHQNQKG